MQTDRNVSSVWGDAKGVRTVLTNGLQCNAVRGNQSKDDAARCNVNLLARKLFATCCRSVHVQRRWPVRRESLGQCLVRLQFVGAVYFDRGNAPQVFDKVWPDADPPKRFIRSVMDNDHWLVMPRDHRPEEETYSHASRESHRNGNDMLHRLTRRR